MNYTLNEDNFICDADGIDPTSAVLVSCDETILDGDGEVDFDATREAEEKTMTAWANEIQAHFGAVHTVFVAPHDGMMIARLDEHIQ